VDFTEPMGADQSMYWDGSAWVYSIASGSLLEKEFTMKAGNYFFASAADFPSGGDYTQTFLHLMSQDAYHLDFKGTEKVVIHSMDTYGYWYQVTMDGKDGFLCFYRGD